jgi:hypothetical protein
VREWRLSNVIFATTAAPRAWSRCSVADTYSKIQIDVFGFLGHLSTVTLPPTKRYLSRPAGSVAAYVDYGFTQCSVGISVNLIPIAATTCIYG